MAARSSWMKGGAVARRSMGLLLGAVLLSTGCGPVSTASTISDASRDLEEAETLHAKRRAPYEYTKARALLEKAKELEGYGQYESASNFARQSRTMSEKAIDVARLAAEREKRDQKFGGRKADTDKAEGGGQ